MSVEPAMPGQTVVLVGGSAGIGLATARMARAEGAEVILTGRNADRLAAAAVEVGAHRAAAFDANDPGALGRFFTDLATEIDHVLVTAGGPSYKPMLQMSRDEVRDALSGHATLALEVARHARTVLRPGGSLTLMGGTGGRRIDRRPGIVSAATAVLPPLTAALALELPCRLVTPGWVPPPGMTTQPLASDFWATQDPMDWQTARPGNSAGPCSGPLFPQPERPDYS